VRHRLVQTVPGSTWLALHSSEQKPGDGVD
jgi:hypothetical protein